MKAVTLSIWLGVACSVASAANVIREWGQHSSPDEYEIFDNLYVVIHCQAGQPHPWKFEAWDTETGTEGIIESITIAPQPVSGIDLRIAPDPASEWGAHSYGARNLKQLDLITNGDQGNWLTALVLRYDYGDATDGAQGKRSFS